MRRASSEGTITPIALVFAGLASCASPPGKGEVQRPHHELEVNLQLESEVPVEPAPAPDAVASKEALEEPPKAETAPPESAEERAERLLVSLGGSVDRDNLLHDDEVRRAVSQMDSQDIEELIFPDGYVDSDVNRSGPVRCTRDEIRDKVDVCAREFVRFIQRYKRFRDNKRFPPKWSTHSDRSVLFVGFSDYELVFSREPFGLKEVRYHNVESGH